MNYCVKIATFLFCSAMDAPWDLGFLLCYIQMKIFLLIYQYSAMETNNQVLLCYSLSVYGQPAIWDVHLSAMWASVYNTSLFRLVMLIRDLCARKESIFLFNCASDSLGCFIYERKDAYSFVCLVCEAFWNKMQQQTLMQIRLLLAIVWTSFLQSLLLHYERESIWKYISFLCKFISDSRLYIFLAAPPFSCLCSSLMLILYL